MTMAETTQVSLRITDENLRKYYSIEFDSQSRKEFYYEYLNQFEGRERDKLLGYNPPRGGVSSNFVTRSGRYPALRFKNMCKNSGGKINPHEIRKKFNNDILCRYGNALVVIDEKSKNIVWDAVCDGL